MTSQRVEGTWISTGGYGRFRGEWVKAHAVKYWSYALAYTDLKQVLVGVILVEHTGDSKKYTC